MTLRRNLKQARAARERAAQARVRSGRCAARFKQQVGARPLTWLMIMGGAGVLGGWLTEKTGNGLKGLWNDPALRTLLRLLGPGSGT